VPLDDLETLLFLGKSLVDRVMAGVAATGRRTVAELRIEARLDNRSLVRHVLRPAEPAVESRPLIDLYRLWLERRPLASPVAALAMVASRVARPTARQLSLLRQREEREAAALGVAVARLEASFGAGCVVRPVLVDTHRPEARVGWEVFAVPGTGTRPSPGASPGTGFLIRMRPPAEVEWRGDVVRWGGRALRLAAVDGPHRVAGEWWQRGFDRSYYWVTVEDGGWLWLFRDERDGRHYLHGVAD
jgi:protein ImuB